MAFPFYNMMFPGMNAGMPGPVPSGHMIPQFPAFHNPNPFPFSQPMMFPNPGGLSPQAGLFHPQANCFPQQGNCYPIPQAVPPHPQHQGPTIYPPGPLPGASMASFQQPYPPPPPVQLPDKQFLWGVFQRVNRDKSGNISASELQSALSNGTWKAFNPETVRMMIGMFGQTTRNKVNFDEFCVLWKYVTDWLNYFQMFDQDCSGNIDKAELKVALMNFGYRLTDKFYKMLIHKFDRDVKGAINFDDFIQCCVVLQALTMSFRSHDLDQDGWVRMTYEQFLTVVFRLRL